MTGNITNMDRTMLLVAEVERNEPNGTQLLVNNAGTAGDDNTKCSKGSLDSR